MFQMLQNFGELPEAAQGFYQSYFTDILTQVFSVVTDTSHTAGIQMHATILAYMFTLVEQNKITVALGPIPDNVLYVQEYVASLLRSAFGHLTDNQIKVFVTGLFNLDQDIQKFKEHLRDFLIQIRVRNIFFKFRQIRSKLKFYHKNSRIFLDSTRILNVFGWGMNYAKKKNFCEFLIIWSHVTTYVPVSQRNFYIIFLFIQKQINQILFNFNAHYTFLTSFR